MNIFTAQLEFMSLDNRSLLRSNLNNRLRHAKILLKARLESFNLVQAIHDEVFEIEKDYQEDDIKELKKAFRREVRKTKEAEILKEQIIQKTSETRNKMLKFSIKNSKLLIRINGRIRRCVELRKIKKYGKAKQRKLMEEYKINFCSMKNLKLVRTCKSTANLAVQPKKEINFSTKVSNLI
mmetsp:Transcript_22012/g.19566  ORF Transcript_22012/g.19566 Transcript_22012/m.19566 type:complete len:181 (-) Transcript_22012:52-594(-)